MAEVSKAWGRKLNKLRDGMSCLLITIVNLSMIGKGQKHPFSSSLVWNTGLASPAEADIETGILPVDIMNIIVIYTWPCTKLPLCSYNIIVLHRITPLIVCCGVLQMMSKRWSLGIKEVPDWDSEEKFWQTAPGKAYHNNENNRATTITRVQKIATVLQSLWLNLDSCMPTFSTIVKHHKSRLHHS